MLSPKGKEMTQKPGVLESLYKRKSVPTWYGHCWQTTVWMLFTLDHGEEERSGDGGGGGGDVLGR